MRVTAGPPAPPREALDEASAVFSGTVASFETFSFEAEVRPDFTEAFWSVELDVDRVWKGPVASTTFVYVWHGPACGYGNFEIGEDFLVYTHQRIDDEVDDDTLFVSFCSRTQPLERAQGDLEELGGGQVPEPGITGARPASEDEEQTPGSANDGYHINVRGIPSAAPPSRQPAPDPHPKLTARPPTPARPTPQQRPETPPGSPPGRSRSSQP